MSEELSVSVFILILSVMILGINLMILYALGDFREEILKILGYKEEES